MFQGASLPTRFTAPMKQPLATAEAGCSSFQRYWLKPATVAEGFTMYSAPASASARQPSGKWRRSDEHTSELQSLMRISYAVFCLKKKNTKDHQPTIITK